MKTPGFDLSHTCHAIHCQSWSLDCCNHCREFSKSKSECFVTLCVSPFLLRLFNSEQCLFEYIEYPHQYRERKYTIGIPAPRHQSNTAAAKLHGVLCTLLLRHHTRPRSLLRTPKLICTLQWTQKCILHTKELTEVFIKCRATLKVSTPRQLSLVAPARLVSMCSGTRGPATRSTRIRVLTTWSTWVCSVYKVRFQQVDCTCVAIVWSWTGPAKRCSFLNAE